MMMNDRRRTARLVEPVSFEIDSEVFDLSSTTLNLSENGLLCRVNKNVPVMTQLNMVLMIPGTKGKARRLRAKGVVVRVEEDMEGMRKLAIFFTELTDTNRRILKSFIENKLKDEKQ